MRAFIASVLLALGCLASPAANAAPPQEEPGRAKLQSYLAASLRQWVREEGRRQAEAGPDLAVADAAARARLAGQDFNQMDIDALVQLVMRECTEQADAELRDVMAEMKAANQQKKAKREELQRSKQEQARQDAALRDEYTQRAQLATPATAQAGDNAVVAPTLAEAQAKADLEDPKAEMDSLSDASEEQQLKLQMLMDRRAKAYELLSNVMKKTSDTAAAINANLK
jgi:hypothetical protein